MYTVDMLCNSRGLNGVTNKIGFELIIETALGMQM